MYIYMYIPSLYNMGEVPLSQYIVKLYERNGCSVLSIVDCYPKNFIKERLINRRSKYC